MAPHIDNRECSAHELDHRGGQRELQGEEGGAYLQGEAGEDLRV
jgi:hypothetical protein